MRLTRFAEIGCVVTALVLAAAFGVEAVRSMSGGEIVDPGASWCAEGEANRKEETSALRWDGSDFIHEKSSRECWRGDIKPIEALPNAPRGTGI